MKASCPTESVRHRLKAAQTDKGVNLHMGAVLLKQQYKGTEGTVICTMKLPVRLDRKMGGTAESYLAFRPRRHKGVEGRKAFFMRKNCIDERNDRE